MSPVVVVRAENGNVLTFYGVYLCGCTDCFLHAAFDNREDALAWAEENSTNPEGYIIKEVEVNEQHM